KQINGFANGWGSGGWGPWAGGLNSFSATTSTINIGTFVLGMYDPAAKKLVWIGAAQHTIEPSKKQEKNQERLNKGAQKLLKDFPPGRKYPPPIQDALHKDSAGKSLSRLSGAL